jgi:hypothetical protein
LAQQFFFIFSNASLYLDILGFQPSTPTLECSTDTVGDVIAFLLGYFLADTQAVRVLALLYALFIYSSQRPLLK